MFVLYLLSTYRSTKTDTVCSPASESAINELKEPLSPATAFKSSKDSAGSSKAKCFSMATVEDGAAAGCKKCQKELRGKKKMGPHDKICPRSNKPTVVNAEVNDSDENNGYVSFILKVASF